MTMSNLTAKCLTNYSRSLLTVKMLCSFTVEPHVISVNEAAVASQQHSVAHRPNTESSGTHAMGIVRCEDLIYVCGCKSSPSHPYRLHIIVMGMCDIPRQYLNFRIIFMGTALVCYRAGLLYCRSLYHLTGR